MGKFNDAVKAGETCLEVQPSVRPTQAESTSEQAMAKRRLRKTWLDIALNPVIADVNEDIKGRDLRFAINAKEDDYSTFVELLFYGYQANPVNLTITVRNDGIVKIYVLSGQGKDIGTTENPDRRLLEDQLVKFLKQQASVPSRKFADKVGRVSGEWSQQ